MAEVRLRKDFYGTKISKVSADSIRVSVGFDYKGPAQTLDIETNTGKRGLWGDYDQESPAYHDSKAVYASDTFRGYTFSRTIPLSFWGDREIDDCAVEVVIRGEGVYGDAVLWDAYTVNIEVVPEFKGTISRKELEYNESQRAIPVSNIPQDERGLVHVWGRNDMATSQKLGIHWIVKDPDGIVVEDYQDWEFGTTGPGDDHHFIGGRFDLNKPGAWAIGVSLTMNPASPLTVDSYAGVLCTVAALPPEEYTLEVTVEPPASGYVTKSPSKAKYSPGEVVTLTAKPYSGYEFDHWGGWPPYPGVGSTSPSISITMTANWWVVAAFRKVAVTQCPLSVSASPSLGGSVTRNPDKSLYDDGEMIDVTATANPGWSFVKFTGVRPDGSTWESTANPVHPRGCRTTSVTAHFIQ